MKKILLFILALCPFLFAFGGCDGTSFMPEERLRGFLCNVENLPAGRYYVTTQDPAAENALSPALIATLFAKADGTCEYDGRVEAAALYLSSGIGPFFEAAVFRCYGSADTDALISMCLRRAALVNELYGTDTAPLIRVSGAEILYCLTFVPPAGKTSGRPFS